MTRTFAVLLHFSPFQPNPPRCRVTRPRARPFASPHPYEDRITLKLVLSDGIQGPSTIGADKRWTSDQLREAVAAAIGRQNRSFRLRKNAAEVRPGPETLSRKGFYNLMALHVSPGRPLELHEEAITVAPVDVGFEAGLGPVPPSVLEALAAGRKTRDAVDPAEAGAAAGGGKGWAAAATGAAVVDRGLGKGGASDDEDASVAACCSLKFPEVDAETGPVREAADAAAAACGDTTAPPSAECSPCHGPLVASGGGGGVSGSSVVSPALLLSLRGVAAEEEGVGGGDSEAPTASVSSSETGLTTPTNYRLGMTAAGAVTEDQAAPPPLPTPAASLALCTPPSTTAAAAAAANPLARATLLPAVTTAEDVPTREDTKQAWAEAAVAAAAAAQNAKAETERLTSTYVEVVPPEPRWGEQFTIAVDRDSTVGDIRRAVWAEMHRRGLGPGRSSPRGSGEGNDDGKAGTAMRHPLESGEGWTPRMLRLRERQVKLPATILRDAEGTVARLRSRPHGVPWLLAAQVLPCEEDLGRSVLPESGGEGGAKGGGRDGGEQERGVAAAAAACVVPPMPEDAKVIVVQWWNRWEWRLTDKYEAWISPSETVADARRRLAEQVRVSGGGGCRAVGGGGRALGKMLFSLLLKEEESVGKDFSSVSSEDVGLVERQNR